MGNRYRSYTHLERLNRPEVEGILNGKVSLFSKLDGTNGVVWSDGESYYAGSRSRELNANKDNANFYNFMTTTEDPEYVALREYCMDYPTYFVYGEWLGLPGGKLLGSIKTYLDTGFFIFDVFDYATGKYLPYEEYYSEISQFYSRVIPRIVELTNPTEEEVAAYVDKCDYNLQEGDVGEGITIKNYDFVDKYGNIQIAKIVRDEYKEKKQAPRPQIEPGEVEKAFVEEVCTNALMNKELNKVLIVCGEEEFNRKNGKVIGMTLNKVFDTVMEEEFYNFFRKRLVTVDLYLVRKLVTDKVRSFLGLI